MCSQSEVFWKSMSAATRNFIRVDQSLLPDHQRIGRDFFIKHNSVYELFHAQAKKYPEKIFAIFPEYDEALSYQDLDSKILERAFYLKRRNISRGDRISLVLPTSPNFLVLYFAAFREGVTVVPINPDLSASEIAYVVADSKAKAV